MKKIMTILALLFTMAITTQAMSYEQARQQALFLTDKMAYELNLTDDQYEAAYEINLDYLMSVNTYDDLYGAYWRYRNTDLSYVLLDWQYRAYCAANYFYRPLYFSDGFWHFGIYARYPHRDYFYFNRPTVYISYRGGHSWRHNGGRSWYDGRRFGPRPGGDHFGMRDGFNRGDYGKGNRQTFGSRTQAPSLRNQTPVNNTNGNRGAFGSRTNRESSTRTTVTRPSTTTGTSNPAFGGRRNNITSSPSGGTVLSSPRSTFGGNRNNNTFSTPRQSSGSSFSTPRQSSGSSFSAPRQSSGSSRSGGSFGGGNSSSSRSGGFGSRR